MKIFFAALVFFLIAFTGLAAGLLLKRKGLRGGCTPAPGNDHECHCKGEKGSDSKGGSREAIQDQGLRKGAENLEP
jgi:hypothetical protein